MKIPTIQGLIDRRILINFAVDPVVAGKIVPAPFRPQIYNGKAIAGICLIRLKGIRPKGFPEFMGIASENGAHRIAVEWDENGQTRTGVFIPRRDTSHWLNTLVGGRLFPGKHYHAKFNVREQNDAYHIDFTSSDKTRISIDARRSDTYNADSIFGTLGKVSDFFEGGSTGYSPNGEQFDGMRLQTFNWKVEPLEVQQVSASFFEDESIFPKGSVKFDNALLMTKLEHEWHSVATK